MSKTRMSSLSKTMPWGLGLAVSLGLVITLSASVAIGHQATVNEAPAPKEPTNTRGAVAMKTVVQEFNGSLADTGNYLSEFMQSFNDQGLGDKMAGFEPQAVVILTSEPVGDQASGYIGFTVPAQFSVGAPLEYQTYRFGDALTYNHAGAYEELCPIYYDIEATSAAADDGGGQPSWPVVLELIDDPRYVASPRTNMIIPFS